MNDNLVECFRHGLQDKTYVCGHIRTSLELGQSPGFVCYPGPDDAFPDAWCDECEELLNTNGAEWSEETEESANISLICASCYVSARDIAAREGRLRVLV